jgi:hypothetical protein
MSVKRLALCALSALAMSGCATQTLFNKAGCQMSNDDNVGGMATLVEGVIVGPIVDIVTGPVQIFDSLAGHPMKPRWDNDCNQTTGSSDDGGKQTPAPETGS